ncbi:Gustatory receptor [Sergentomyia squamirostris]
MFSDASGVTRFKLAKCLIGFYQLTGMLMITIPRKAGRELYLIFLGFFYVIFLIITMSVALYNFKYLFDTRNPLGLFMDVIQLAVPIGSHIVILVRTFTSRRFHRKIWELYGKVDRSLRLCDIETGKNIESFLKKYSWKFVILIVFGCGLEVVIIFIISPGSSGWRVQRAMAIVPFLGNRLCQLMMMFYSEFHREFLTIIVQEFLKLVQDCNDDFATKPIQQFLLYRKCKCLKDNYNSLWLSVKYINKCFGLSIFFNIGMNFIILIVDYYWNFKAFYLNSSNSRLASSLCSVPLVAVLLPFIQSCDNTLRPLREVKSSLGKMKLHRENKYLNRLIKQFSLEVLQHEIELEASRFFSINYELLQGFISAMSIYLVIFIQFELADNYTYTVPM